MKAGLSNKGLSRMQQLATTQQTRRVPRCLLIEDSDFDQRRISRILARGVPVELEIASSLSDARGKLADAAFDLILLDNSLPDGLGVDFAAELRQNKSLTEIPILMISDWPTPFMYDKASAARVGMVLGKDDFQPRHIREALRFARVVAMAKH